MTPRCTFYCRSQHWSYRALSHLYLVTFLAPEIKICWVWSWIFSRLNKARPYKTYQFVLQTCFVDYKRLKLHSPTIFTPTLLLFTAGPLHFIVKVQHFHAWWPGSGWLQNLRVRLSNVSQRNSIFFLDSFVLHNFSTYS